MYVDQKKKRIEKKELKDQNEEEKLYIFKKREFQSKYIKKQDKIILQSNNIDIGEYICPGLSKFFKDFQKESCRWKQLDTKL